MALQKWKISAPARKCAVTGSVFEPDQTIYSFLFKQEDGTLARVDIAESALGDYLEEPEAEEAFSTWKGKFRPGQARPEGEEETAVSEPGEAAEDALRALSEENAIDTRHSRYVLALYLERKKRIKPVDTKTGVAEDPVIIYEHRKTGEVFVVPEPELDVARLDAAREALAEVMR
jgi:hypothetical protein